MHPAIKSLFEGGTVIQYGARTLNEGGYQVYILYCCGEICCCYCFSNLK